MELVDAITLGLIQGLTEFIPVASGGHLSLLRGMLTIDDSHMLALGAVLYLATAIAAATYFWFDVWGLIQVGLRRLGRLPVNDKDITRLYALIIGTIPSVIVFLLLEPIIASYFQPKVVVATILFVSAIFFLYAEWRYYLNPVSSELSVRSGAWMGLCQFLASITGASRFGVTIAGGMLLGLSRYEAARFSFLLAIPITLTVGIKKFVDFLAVEGEVTWWLIIISAVIAFMSALVVIHLFLRFIQRYTLWSFVWYNLILAGFIGYVAAFA